MKARDLAAGLFDSLRAQGCEDGELYLKSGRSRRFELGSHGRVSGSSHERGWAVRAGDTRGSFFLAGTGNPDGAIEWPARDGGPILLPVATPVAPWRPPRDLEASLTAEGEAIALLEAIERGLASELPGARLLRGLLEEGTSETSILNTRGVDATFRSRAAVLRVEAVGPWKGAPASCLTSAQREVRRFQPVAVAKRLANRLLLAHEGSAPDKERGELLIGSAVAIRILAGLLPLLLDPAGRPLARRYRDRRGRIGSAALTVVDNGRYPGGLLEAPVDGEGRPTGELVLIEEGRYRQSLADWRRATGALEPQVGCLRRDSWRDLPRLAPSHLYIQPDPEVAVGTLLGAVARGYYLVEPTGGGRFDLERDRFWLPVCGLVLRQGRATSPLANAVLEGGVRAFLHGVRATARDLAFEPLKGMIGSPTLLVNGLGLRRADLS